MICTRCPSTATHYPRVTFTSPFGGHARWILDLPLCAEHLTPLPEQVLLWASKLPPSDIRIGLMAAFHFKWGSYPDPLLTTVEYLSEADYDVRGAKQRWADHKAKLPPEERKLSIAVTFLEREEFDWVMSQAPDIAIR